MVTFVILGTALLKAIDTSLQNHKHRKSQQALKTAGRVQGAKGGGGDHKLLEAKRKIKTVMAVDVVLVLSGSSITILAVITGFDMEVPLIMFGVTFAYVPLIWLALNVQVHSGRSRLHRQEALRSTMDSRLPYPGSRLHLHTGLRSTLYSSRKLQERFQ